MQVDIYRDDALERCLIVKHGQDIETLSAISPEFKKGLSYQRDIDTDFDKLPTGLIKNDVLSAIEDHGYHASRFTTGIQEIQP